MMLNRWHLPDAPLRARVIAITMSGLIGVIVLAWAARAGLHLGVSYPIKAGLVFTAVLMLAAGFLHGYHPYAQLGPANRITTARAMLLALVIGLVGEPVSAAGAVAPGRLTAPRRGGWRSRRGEHDCRRAGRRRRLAGASKPDGKRVRRPVRYGN